MNIIRLVFFAGVIALACGAEVADKSLSDAVLRGADASLEIFVHDECGDPVPNARVEYAFWLVDRKRTVSVSAKTDSRGLCMARGKCSADVHVSVSCDGHYESRIERYMKNFAQGQAVVGGKWQPHGARLPILLRKQVNPVPLEQHYVHRMAIVATNVWMGFDMEMKAFVMPYGEGLVSDFEIKFDWNGEVRRRYMGSSLGIRFPPPSGGYWFKKMNESEFKGPFAADANAVYLSNFSFSEVKVGETWREQLFPKENELVVRTRCETDEKGNLKKACYGKISLLRFGWGDNGRGDLRLEYFRNPKVNDPNLESGHVVRTMKDIERKMDGLPSVK